MIEWIETLPRFIEGRFEDRVVAVIWAPGPPCDDHGNEIVFEDPSQAPPQLWRMGTCLNWPGDTCHDYASRKIAEQAAEDVLAIYQESSS